MMDLGAQLRSKVADLKETEEALKTPNLPPSIERVLSKLRGDLEADLLDFVLRFADRLSVLESPFEPRPWGNRWCRCGTNPNNFPQDRGCPSCLRVWPENLIDHDPSRK